MHISQNFQRFFYTFCIWFNPEFDTVLYIVYNCHQFHETLDSLLPFNLLCQWILNSNRNFWMLFSRIEFGPPCTLLWTTRASIKQTDLRPAISNGHRSSRGTFTFGTEKKKLVERPPRPPTRRTYGKRKRPRSISRAALHEILRLRDSAVCRGFVSRVTFFFGFFFSSLVKASS